MANRPHLTMYLRSVFSFFCRRLLLRLVGTCLTLSLFFPLPVFAAIGLQIDEVTVEGGRVRFRVGSCNWELPPQPQNLQQMPRDETSRYLVYADLNNSERANFGYFVYKFIVQAKALPPGSAQVCAFSAQAFPSGDFIDQIAEAPFRVGEATRMEEGSVRLPIHSLSYSKPILECSPAETIADVSLSSETQILLRLANVLHDLPLEISNDVRVSTERDNWKKNGQAPRATVQLPNSQRPFLRPGQKLDEGIRLVLNPNPWHALGASIFPIRPGKPHETIHLSLDYRSPGGTPAALEIPIPIRFTPSFWNLLIAVLLGSILGSTAGWLLSKRNHEGHAPWYISFSMGLIAGILAEALAIALVYANSDFRLVGFELDPYQILPAFLIGAIVALVGFRRAENFLKLFRQRG